MLLSLNVDELAQELHAALDDKRSQEPIRTLLTRFAEEHGIAV